MMAAPMTYSVDGEQYIAIMAGTGGSLGSVYPPGSAADKYGNKGRIVAFKLTGGEVPQREKLEQQQSEFPKPQVVRRGSSAERDQGGLLFQRHCSKCHTNLGGGGIPDLRLMSEQTHIDFLDIVLGGVRADKGMGSFKDLLSIEEAQSIHSFLIDLAWSSYEQGRQVLVPHQTEGPED